MRETVLEAVLRSADAPSEAQRNRFAAFLKKQYGQEVPLRWEQDPGADRIAAGHGPHPLPPDRAGRHRLPGGKRLPAGGWRRPV